MAHYCVRPWPWIIVGLVPMVLYPGLVDKEAGYVMVMRDHLPAEPDDHLIAFYRRTRPDGPGWGPIASRAGGPPPTPLGGLLIDWAAGVVLVYAALFGLGHALVGSLAIAFLCLLAAAAAVWIIARDLSRRGWHTVTG